MKITNITNPFRRNRTQGEDDLGFGTRLTGTTGRLINPDGSFNIRRTGRITLTPYQWMLELTWTEFFLFITLAYCLINSFFAFLFMLIGMDNLIGVPDGTLIMDFAHAFFFSVQTFTTVGYGAISPDGLAANIIASADALVGLMAFALATGLFFARFSRPVARILFCTNALISPYKDGYAFMFRIAGKDDKKIIDVSAVVSMTWVEPDESGQMKRRFASMKLERSEIVLFPLNWTIVHAIRPGSPLEGLHADDLERIRAEFLILVEGFDETFAQQVHASRSFTWNEVKWYKRFQPMYHTKDGETYLELDKIDDHIAVPFEEEE